MPVYRYEALDSQGVEVIDRIEALTDKEAACKIRKLGYYPVSVAAERLAARRIASEERKKKSRRRRAQGKVKTKYVTEFARELATLQQAGLPIMRSLKALEEQEGSGTLKKVIGSLAEDIEGGSTLSESMSRYPRCFDRLFVGMVSAGETGGVLDVILCRVADFMEKSERLRQRVKSAMVYPATVMTAAFVILLLLMTFVIPVFRRMLIDMGAPMNPLSEIVLGVAGWIAYDYGWLVMIGIPVGLLAAVRVMRKFRPTRTVLDAVNLRLPVVKELTKNICVTRWTRTLGTLLTAGVPILEAITVARDVTGNEIYSNMLGNIHDSIRQGDTFAAPLRRSKLVRPSVRHMIAVGEESGDLDKMLIRIADKYDEKTDVMVASLMSLLEPLTIILLGVMVLLIVLAVMLPIFSIPFQGLAN
jgi:type IV pilus assembly protein PilC